MNVCRCGHSSLRGLIAGLALLALAGCETMNVVMATGASVAAGMGYISHGQAEALSKVGDSFRDITPEQEYYIGRAVGATLVSRYKPWRREAADQYLNVMGQALAQFSDLPQTFGGYRFLVLDSDEVNAFAAPGGLIFVTRGLLNCCPDEDSVAAVLAHEIGHIQNKHGLQSIQKSRLTSAFALLGTESVKSYGAAELSTLVGAFEGSIQDTVTTLVNNGYSRAFEAEADAAAVAILQRSGYRPAALVTMLGEMKKRLKPGAAGFGKTHPAPDDRISEIQVLLPVDRVVDGRMLKVRQQRLSKALKGT